MTHLNYEETRFSVREDIKVAYRSYWQELVLPGCWWTGPERIAIVKETRNDVHCGFLFERKQALSSYHLDGHHDGDTASESTNALLNELTIDAVHRVITDQGRITQAYVDRLIKAGINAGKYVELVGVVVTFFQY